MPERSTPELGTLLMDITKNQIGEFRGEWAGRWSLRPPKGGREWEVDPDDAQLATAEQKLAAQVARVNALSRVNARSRGEVL